MQALQLFADQLISGIQIGSVYALIAVGYTMVYGVLKFINFAHGDVYMVGAYTGLLLLTAGLVSMGPIQQAVATLLICMLVCAALGAFIERLAYRPLRNGLSASDSVPWALFWALYVALFGGIALAHITGLGRLQASLIALALGFVILLPVLRWLFARISLHVSPSRGRLTALITAIGMSMLLENQGQAVFGATPQGHQIKGFEGGERLSLGPHFAIRISTGHLTLLLAALVLTAMLVYMVRYTRPGRAIRAVSFDPEAAALMGIPTDRVISLTFIIGSALAGAAGFLNHMLTGITFDPYIGIPLGLKAFIAAVLGGIGSIEGAVLGGLVMGVAETFTSGSSLSSFADAMAFVILIVVLLFKPSGLMGTNLPEKV